MHCLHKNYIITIWILSRGYLQDLFTIFTLSICYLYSVLYISTTDLISVLSYVSNIYIYTHYTVHTYTYLVSYTDLCQYSPHTPDRTHPQGAGGGGWRENPHYIYPLIYLLYMSSCVYIYCMYVYIYIYLSIYPLLTYLPHNGGGGDHWYLYTYLSSYISIYSLSLHLGIITTFVLYMITYPYRPHGSVDVQCSPMGIYDHLFTGGRGSHILTYPRSYIPTPTHP